MIEEVLRFVELNYFLLIYGLAWIISIIFYKKYFDTVLKYFPILIAYTFLNELLGFLIGTSENFAFFNNYEFSNDLLYNLYAIIFYPYFYLIYWKLTHKQQLKNIIKIASILSLLFFILNIFYANPLLKVLYYSIVVFSIILVICLCIYLIDKKNDWRWNREKYNIMTWVSLGLLVFHIFFPIIFLISFLNYDFWKKFNLWTIHKVIIIIMYLLFCVGFIVSRRKAFK
jgi:hypothetical protein